MWIRSQNKEKLVNVNDVWINQNKTIFEIKYTTSFAPTHYTVSLGEYKTKERAMGVLDMIQNQLTNISSVKENQVATSTGWLKHEYREVVFEMPLE